MNKRLISCLLILATSLFAVSQGFAARIDGYKFNDLNGNGVDNSEPRLSGFQIVLQSETDPDLLLERTTNGNGQFSFRNLPAGVYQVCEIAPIVTPLWIPTTPECVTVTLRGKNSEVHIRFGNKREEGGNGGIGCTRTQGYWGSSPAGQLRLIQLVPGTMNLGNPAYSSSQLDDILDTPPAGGNALLSLAHQLIAAKLNVLAGANSSAIATAITLADSLIANLVIPPVGTDSVHNSTTLGQQMNDVKDDLDDYNNGRLNVPHCE